MTKKKPCPITPAEINQRNREFWAEASADFERNIKRRPHDAVIAAEQEAEAIRMAEANDVEAGRARALKESASMEKRVADIARSHSYAQQARAKKPRPKLRPTCRTVTIKAMHLARIDGQAFQDFLDAAHLGSIDGLSITPERRPGVEKFVVEVDGVSDPRRVSRSTLADWWAAASD